MELSPELVKWKKKIQKRAGELGLDFFPVRFEVLDFDELNAVAAFGGFPVRYHHYSFGESYEDLRQKYKFGLQTIYEMVINTDPSIGYLLERNKLIDQKIVMAHVYAHVDFFKNNIWFSKTNRNMVNREKHYAAVIDRITTEVGEDAVEDFIDTCKSIENLIDPDSLFVSENLVHGAPPVRKFPAEKHMDQFINPPEVLEEERKEIMKKMKKKRRFPPEPQRDVLGFLIENAPMPEWKKEILSIIREEAYYFVPQGQTKIMNEGWASYWHEKMMLGETKDGKRTIEALVDESEVSDFTNHHSGTLASYPWMLNPYRLGHDLLMDIEERWDKGKHGKEWCECIDANKKDCWDTEDKKGKEKIFEVRKYFNDVQFINTFLTQEFCDKHMFYVWEFNPFDRKYYIVSRDVQDVKDKLTFSLDNLGRPFISVVDSNYGNKGELYMWHDHKGMDLMFYSDKGIPYVEETLKNIYKVWKRPVHIETLVDVFTAGQLLEDDPGTLQNLFNDSDDFDNAAPGFRAVEYDGKEIFVPDLIPMVFSFDGDEFYYDSLEWEETETRKQGLEKPACPHIIYRLMGY